MADHVRGPEESDVLAVPDEGHPHHQNMEHLHGNTLRQLHQFGPEIRFNLKHLTPLSSSVQDPQGGGVPSGPQEPGAALPGLPQGQPGLADVRGRGPYAG